VVVSLALTRSPAPVPRVHGADMIGAAVGWLAVPALLSLTDAVSALLWSAALAGAGGLLFHLVVGATAIISGRMIRPLGIVFPIVIPGFLLFFVPRGPGGGATGGGNDPVILDAGSAHSLDSPRLMPLSRPRPGHIEGKVVAS